MSQGTICNCKQHRLIQQTLITDKNVNKGMQMLASNRIKQLENYIQKLDMSQL